MCSSICAHLNIKCVTVCAPSNQVTRARNRANWIKGVPGRSPTNMPQRRCRCVWTAACQSAHNTTRMDAHFATQARVCVCALYWYDMCRTIIARWWIPARASAAAPNKAKAPKCRHLLGSNQNQLMPTSTAHHHSHILLLILYRNIRKHQNETQMSCGIPPPQ